MLIFGQLMLYAIGGVLIAYGLWAHGEVKKLRSRIAELEQDNRDLSQALSEDVVRKHGPGTAP